MVVWFKATTLSPQISVSLRPHNNGNIFILLLYKYIGLCIENAWHRSWHIASPENIVPSILFSDVERGQEARSFPCQSHAACFYLYKRRSQFTEIDNEKKRKKIKTRPAFCIVSIRILLENGTHRLS